MTAIKSGEIKDEFNRLYFFLPLVTDGSEENNQYRKSVSITPIDIRQELLDIWADNTSFDPSKLLFFGLWKNNEWSRRKMLETYQWRFQFKPVNGMRMFFSFDAEYQTFLLEELNKLSSEVFLKIWLRRTSLFLIFWGKHWTHLFLPFFDSVFIVTYFLESSKTAGKCQLRTCFNTVSFWFKEKRQNCKKLLWSCRLSVGNKY